MKPRRASDSPYKVLFQDRGLLAETVCLLVPELAATLDFGTAAALDKEHLTAAARTRLQDKLHRVEHRTGALRNGRRPYLLVLLEFQSRRDRHMAWRMRDYLHLVESGLRETGTFAQEGQMPAMLSAVVHNGQRPWSAAATWTAPLTGDGPPVQVPMYGTVDLPVLATGPDGGGCRLTAGSRLATLAGLESAPQAHLPRLLLAAFRRYGGAESAAFRRGLHLRVAAVLARGDASRLPSLAVCEQLLAEKQGEKMTAMLDATMARWAEAKVAEGVAQGLEQGVAQGKAQGLEEGVAQGKAQGLEQGKAQGRMEMFGQLVAVRFGAGVAAQATALLADGSRDLPLDASKWLLGSETPAALLARLRTTTPTAGNGAAQGT